MSDFSKALHGLEDLLTFKTDYNGFHQAEAAVYEHRITQLPPVVQPAAEVALDSLKVGASSLVGVGMTALGPIIEANSDDQANMLMKLMTIAGIPTEGPLSIAEHAALVMLINGLKAYLDKLHLHFATQDVPAPAPAVAAAAAAPVAKAA